MHSSEVIGEDGLQRSALGIADQDVHAGQGETRSRALRRALSYINTIRDITVTVKARSGPRSAVLWLGAQLPYMRVHGAPGCRER